MKALSLSFAVGLAVGAGASAPGHAHETFAAGTPGAAAITGRTVDLTIRERPDGRMSFDSGDLRARTGEQIRFVVRNAGKAPHEFRLDSEAGNAAHKAMMAEMPGMVHHDANAVSIPPGQTRSLVWRFTKAGTYEFACLLPGHYEAGMHGAVVVAK